MKNENNRLFNTNAISVAENWEGYLNRSGLVDVSDFKSMSEGVKKQKIEKEKNDELNYTSCSGLFSFGFSLLLLKEDIECSNYLIDSSVILGKKIYKSEIVGNKKIIDEVEEKYKYSSLAIYAGKRLETYVSLACAKSVSYPNIPDPEILNDAINKFNENLIKIKGNLGYSERLDSILASVMALLAGSYELSLELLDRCKKYKEMKYHRGILKNINIELIKNSGKNEVISNHKIESEFFELFNAYRLPIYFQTQGVLKEPPILSNPLGNYLFAWLYLKLFKGQEESTWEEMRIIMMQ